VYMNGTWKHSILLQYDNHYNCKMFYSMGPLQLEICAKNCQKGGHYFQRKF
jgi:hypothetical protein